MSNKECKHGHRTGFTELARAHLTTNATSSHREHCSMHSTAEWKAEATKHRPQHLDTLQLRNNDTNDIDPSSSQSLKQDKQDRECVVVEYQTSQSVPHAVTFVYKTKNLSLCRCLAHTQKCIMHDKNTTTNSAFTILC